MRKFRDLPIRRKLVLVIMVTSTAALLVTGLSAVTYELMHYRRAMVRDLTTQAQIAGAYGETALTFGDPKVGEEILSALHARSEIVFACFYTTNGQPFAQYNPQGKFSPPRLEADGYRYEGGHILLFRQIKSGNDPVGSICLRADLRGERNQILSYVGITGSVMLASLVVALLLSTSLQRLISEPILALAAVARGVTNQRDYSLRAAKKTEDEIGALVDGFNQMLAQIQARDQELRASEQRFRQLAETIHEVFWMSNLEKTQIIYVSPAYEEIWGRSCSSLYASPTSWMEAIHPDDRERIAQAAMVKQIRGDYDEEYRIVRPSGSTRWIRDRAFPIRDEQGAVYRIAGIAEDITESKRAEETRRRLAAIVESSEDAIIGETLDGVVVSWNKAAQKMYGYAAEEIIGRSISLIVPGDHSGEIDRILQKLRGGEVVTHYETVWVAKDGRRMDVALTVSPMRNENSLVMGASVIARDMTERKRLEKQILEISDREQGRMGQDLHDGLCQHLVSTAFASNLLRQKLAGKSSPEEKDAGEIAKLLDDAITQARSLARGLYPVKLEAEGFVSAVEELASNVTERFGIDCLVTCPQAVSISDNAVATHLYRIVQEAVANAVKHSKAKRIVIGLTAADHELAIKVADDGIGIGQPFGSTAGMGLHIMQYRARMIGGKLKVGRGENGGTIILCSLEQKSIE